MGRAGRVLWGCGLLLATWVAAPAHARGDDAERQARRHELRQQLQAERERWRGDERGRGPGGYGAPPGYAPGGGYRTPPGYGPGGGHGAPPGYAPGPGAGAPPGWGGGHRLTPDERRALRPERRQQRP